MIHTRFCGNCPSTVTTSLRLAGSPPEPLPYCRGLSTFSAEELRLEAESLSGQADGTDRTMHQ